MLSDKEIICPNNLLDAAHKKKGVSAGIVNAGKPLPMHSVMNAVSEGLIFPIFIGDEKEIKKCADDLKWNISNYEIINESNEGKNIGILFGREDRGLTNDELQRCNLHVHIPANENYPVLNIAMAVQVVCYQLYIDSHKNAIANKSSYWDVPLAESNHVERLINHFVEVAAELEVFNKGNPRQIGARIKRMFTRIGLDEMEVNFFRGFLGAVEKKLKNK